MDTAEIRRRFVAHFEAAGHQAVPSASLLVPDPTLLFVNAGMVPFKPFFLGEETPPWPRATSVQKCIRTPDIEDVGKTTRHGTFFEMCGNFSFGDYFKEGAIELAWDLVTKSQAEGGWGLEESRLWPSVLHGDDEALALWMKVTGLPEHRIVKLGPKENYWSMGVPGPGGPCSEILYDRGPAYGPEADWTAMGTDMDPALEDRYLEIWNLVFMQDELSAVRSKADFDIVGSLPKRNIDTGMGLERVAFLLQGCENMYEIDVMYPVIQMAEELTGRKYGKNTGPDSRQDDVRFRVVADHVRSSMMLIGDGVTPGNEGRGYVLRRLLRRAVRSMRLLGYEDPALPALLPVSRDKMGETYTELHRDWDRISTVAIAEEQAFRQTLRTGTTIFDTAATEVRSGGGTMLSGDKAFALHDTYGFPIDLTLEMAAEKGLSVDEPGFRRLMTEQRERARADAKSKKGKQASQGAYREIADSLGQRVDFTGYSDVVSEGAVRGIVSDGVAVESAGEGADIELVLDRTPFYAEGGGQLADQGVIELDNGARIEVYDVQSPITGLVVHKARVLNGEVSVGGHAQSLVDVERRASISRSHTATHMVHKAFREALGETATQAGSENSPGRFRFDFSASGAVPESAMVDVEARVNDLVMADLGVHAEIMTQEEAVRSGAMALFGEKYGDQVRVVSVGDWARELCGGTHAHRSGQLGVVKLLGESSIGSGVRRVEALVGGDAYRFLAREHVLVAQLSEALKVRPEQLPERVNDIVERLRSAEKEIEKVRLQQLMASAGELVTGAEDIGGIAFVGHEVPGASGGDVRTLALDIRNRLAGDRAGVVAVLGSANDKPSVVVAVNDAGRAAGVSANTLVRAASGVLGGKGGGKDDVAQGGGSDVTRTGEALAAIRQVLAEGRAGR
jgi:alanyl-tRNA synthetase